MREKFRGKYRIESTRLKNWDYGWNGLYFITICTGGRECYFGGIENNELKLSETGNIADRIWCRIPEKFCFMDLDSYVIMPNHIHGILKINKTGDYNENYSNVNLQREGNSDTIIRDAINRVSSTEMKQSSCDENNLNTEKQKGGIRMDKQPNNDIRKRGYL